MHNCWAVCGTVSTDWQHNCAAEQQRGAMLAAIQAFARHGPADQRRSPLVISKALSLTQGTVASGANRYDANVIAKYEFQTGTGLTAYDTSGVDPSADLTLSAA